MDGRRRTLECHDVNHRLWILESMDIDTLLDIKATITIVSSLED